MTACTNTQECQQECAPGMYLCRDCVDKLAGLIRSAWTLLTLAEDAVAKQLASRNPGRSSSAVSAAPVNFDAITWRDSLTTFLSVYSLDDQGTPPQDHAWRIARSGNGGLIIHELKFRIRKMRMIVDLPTMRTRLDKCGMPGCTGSYTYLPGDTEATCNACKAWVPIMDQRRYQLTQHQGRPLPLAELLRVLKTAGTPVNASTVRSWIHRKKLKSVVTDSKGRALYTADQVLDLAAVPA